MTRARPSRALPVTPASAEPRAEPRPGPEPALQAQRPAHPSARLSPGRGSRADICRLRAWRSRGSGRHRGTQCFRSLRTHLSAT